MPIKHIKNKAKQNVNSQSQREWWASRNLQKFDLMLKH